MSSFEFVFGMISVITSLALSRLLSGFVGLYRHSDRVRFSFRHACWSAMALMLLLGNWASFWRMRDIQAWGALDVLSPLILASVLYAFCELVVPDEPKGGEVLDLRDYHALQGRRYKTMQLAFAVVVLLYIARDSASFDEWLVASGFALVAAACCVIALLARRAWLDTLAAVVLVAMAPPFLWLHLGALAR